MSTWNSNHTSSYSLPSYRKRLFSYGVLWGSLTFLAGIGITLATLPETFANVEVEGWRIATWIWLNAHGVGIDGMQVGGLNMAFQTVGFISNNPELHMLRVVPLLLAAICGLVVTATMGGASRDKHVLENSIVAVGGYVLAGLGAVVVSEARPGVGMIVVLILVLGGALYTGSLVANRLPIPVFAVTTLSGLLGIGLFVFLAAGVVSTVAIPLGKHAAAGGVVASVALWVASNLD